jgi:hypothetical protein
MHLLEDVAAVLAVDRENDIREIEATEGSAEVYVPKLTSSKST